MHSAVRWLSFIFLMVGFLSPAWSQSLQVPSAMAADLGEGFDKQSPEEIEKANRMIHDLFQDAVDPDKLSDADKNEILDRYQYLDPDHEVPSDLLRTAVLYFDRNKERFPNQRYIGVIDYKPRSDQYRFFVINLASGKVEKHYTAHGWGSDLDKDGVAERFSNIINSGTSSLGFVRTAEVYSGAYRRSLRLDGLSKTNSRVRERAIVVHGWNEVHERPEIQGLGWGCPALDYSVKDRVIDQIKEGALLYMGVSGQSSSSPLGSIATTALPGFEAIQDKRPEEKQIIGVNR